jgi:hypothetical protein
MTKLHSYLNFAGSTRHGERRSDPSVACSTGAARGATRSHPSSVRRTGAVRRAPRVDEKLTHPQELRPFHGGQGTG